MNNITFCKKLREIAEDYNTVYMKGVFGAPVNEHTVSSKSAQYSKWYTEEKQKAFKKLFGKNYFGFDCVCLIKGVLWGWNGDENHIYGGARYGKNGVPDVSVDGMKSICEGVTKDFSVIEKGELLFMPGHVGVYLGDGMACECTPKWENKVQITGVKNLGSTITNSRKWDYHGKLTAFIEYKPDALPAPDKKLPKRVAIGKIDEYKDTGNNIDTTGKWDGHNSRYMKMLEKTIYRRK